MNSVNIQKHIQELNFNLLCITKGNRNDLCKIMGDEGNILHITNLHNVLANSFFIEQVKKEDVVILSDLDFDGNTLEEIYMNFSKFDSALKDVGIEDFDLSNTNTKLNIITTAIGNDKEEVFNEYTLSEIISWYKTLKEVINYEQEPIKNEK